MMSSATTNTDIQDENHNKVIRACPLLTCTYVPTLYSLRDITNEFIRVLKIHHGDALSSAEMATWLGMEEDEVITVGDLICVDKSMELPKDKCDGGDDDDIICKVYNTVKKRYQYALVERIRHKIDECIKCHGEETLESAVLKQPSLLADRVAQEMELTREDVIWLCHDISTTQPTYCHHIENQVLAVLSGISTPTPLGSVFDQDLALIIPIVKTLCEQGRLPGNMSSSNNAVYTPYIFTHFQRSVIDSFFRTNGYITEKKCVGVGLSRKRAECFVRESFPNAISLVHSNSIVEPEVICQPLEVAIQSAVLNDGYADLRSAIPLDIASNYDDVEKVINGCLVDSLKKQQDSSTYDAFMKGTALISNDIAIFFSHEMCEKSVKMLDPMIENYSKERAKEIVEKKSGKKDKVSVASLGSTADIVSLRDVMNCIGKNYPDLLQLQRDYQEDSNGETSLSWSSDEVCRCDGPLIEFCRAVVFSEINHKCTRAVKAEVASLESALHGVSISEHAGGAAKQMDVQETFETSFKDLCHLLQLLAKTIENFSAKGVFTSTEIISMKQELLSQTGSCLARLITEYCLYKNDATGAHALTFSDESHKSSDSVGAPSYASALDFPSWSLKYNPTLGGKQTDPLQHLRETLPGSSGLNLVSMWKLCGTPNHADSQLSEFISHLEESCLTLVGIPFSILDKKAEKKMLAFRRQGLIDRLEKSSEQDEILHTCVILIYQQIKSLVVVGKTMTSLVMNLFEQEKKIPAKVTEVLLELKQHNDSELVCLAKQFGTAKNSKALATISETIKK